MKPPITLATLAAALLLSACGEKVQTAGARKTDGQPWEGPQSSFTAADWKPSDRAAWEQQLRKRSQGQNEYSRAPAQP